MPHASCLTACFSTLPEQEIASPLVIERFRHRIDSNEQCFRLFESTEFHFGAREKVDGANGDRVGLVLLHDRAKPRLRLGEAAPLIRAERRGICVGRTARARRRCLRAHNEQRQESGRAAERHSVIVAQRQLCRYDAMTLFSAAMNLSLAILGGGRAAWAYGSAWRRIGWAIDGVWLRAESQSRLPELLRAPRKSIDQLHADLLLIAVSDRAIDEVASLIPQTASIIFHASGAKASVRDGFSLHPLKALPPVGEPSDLDDALLVFEGNHRDIAQSIAGNIGARFAVVSKEEKPRYHAAAVFGSNYIAALLDIAQCHIGIENARDDL